MLDTNRSNDLYMASSETTTSNQHTTDASSREEQEAATSMAPIVHPGTFSTINPGNSSSVPLPPPPIDGSEISAMTDVNSLEGQGMAETNPADPALEKGVTVVTGNVLSGVPAQVILDTNHKTDNYALATPQLDVIMPNPPLILPIDSGVNSSNDADSGSIGAQSDPSPKAVAKPIDQMHQQQRSLSIDGTTPVEIETDEEQFDEYIRSPEVQNAIVERSPGGRYVRFMEKLGSGASKDVYRAYDTQEGIEVAWNVVNLGGVPKSERNRIVNEVRLLERLHHHNIISFHGSWVNRERQEVNFVTEILSSGTLKSFIAKVQVIRWKIAKRWAVQILKGLEYLHSQEPPVIHRDLKCDNIFINGTSGDLRIGDLGLSTVHRNGRVLSVLGTPEFMAPDMYEDTSYDEKVDIYAFGMCMLEILTKEIPYQECRNPAQIYKKVSSGEPPEVLSRLQSRHARDFVLYCLGYKDEETGRYVRPSATELLQHTFLAQRSNEDDEVVVDPPLRERVIAEEPSTTSSIGTPMKSQSIDVNRGASGSPPQQRTSENPHSSSMRSSPPPRSYINERKSSLDEDLSDKFDEMPQTESNIRKVKVMMGRDTELEEDEPKAEAVGNKDLTQSNSAQAPAEVVEVNRPAVQPPAPSRPASQEGPFQSAAQAQSIQAPQAQRISQHYLVAAAVIENERPDTRPYPDDVLKLVVTLPVEGQTQNVQFDFHLVQDDPIQVAKEMVQELGIPPGAVLEISETISGLARAARMRVDNFYSMRPGPVPGLGQSRSTSQQGQALQQQQQHLDHSQMQSYDANQSMGHAVHDFNPSAQQQSHTVHHPTAPAPQHSLPVQDYSNSVQGGQQQQMSHGSEYQNTSHYQSQVQATQQHAPLQDYPGQAQVQHSVHGSPTNHHQQQQQQQHQRNQGPASNHGVHVPNHQSVIQQHGVVADHSAHMPLHQPVTQQGGSSDHGLQIPNHQPVTQQRMVADHGVHVPNHQPMAQQPMYVQHQGMAYGGTVQSQPQSTQSSSFVQHQTPMQSQPQQPMTMPPPMNLPPQNQMPAPQISQSDQSMHGQTHAIAAQQGSSVPPSLSQQQQQGMSFASSQSLQPAQPLPQHGSSKSDWSQQSNNPSPPTVHSVQSGQNLYQGASQGVGTGEGEQISSAPARSTAAAAPPSSHTRHSTSPELNSVMPPKLMQRSSTTGSPSNSGHRRRQPSLSATPEQMSLQDGFFGDVESADPDMEEELRKLDEDFQRNLQRAQKVFVNRMDNLQRSQIEREAQHKKTLEKHEKERAEFEKRLAQEEEQQNKRLEQLQREWDKRRESLARKKLMEAAGQSGTNGIYASSNQELSQELAPAFSSNAPSIPPASTESQGIGMNQRSNSITSQSAGVGMSQEYVSEQDMNAADEAR